MGRMWVGGVTGWDWWGFGAWNQQNGVGVGWWDHRMGLVWFWGMGSQNGIGVGWFSPQLNSSRCDGIPHLDPAPHQYWEERKGFFPSSLSSAAKNTICTPNGEGALQARGFAPHHPLYFLSHQLPPRFPALTSPARSGSGARWWKGGPRASKRPSPPAGSSVGPTTKLSMGRSLISWARAPTL